MKKRIANKKFMLILFALWMIAVPNVLAEDKQPSGTVEISEYELAYIFNDAMGGGKLHFKGNTY